MSIIEPASTISEWGRIAAQGLLENSGTGPYASQAQLVAGALTSTGKAVTSTQPAVIAAAVLHAATSVRPRTRYPAGNGARAILTLRRILPDRLFDSVVMLVLKRVASGKM